MAFLSLNASEFVEMFVGVGASRVRDLFAQVSTFLSAWSGLQRTEHGQSSPLNSITQSVSGPNVAREY